MKEKDKNSLQKILFKSFVTALAITLFFFFLYSGYLIKLINITVIVVSLVYGAVAANEARKQKDYRVKALRWFGVAILFLIIILK